GEAFDRDPFLLFELRGRTKAQVLEALRAARGGEPAAAAPRKRKSAAKAGGASGRGTDSTVELATATVSLGRVKAEDYDAPASVLPSLRFHFEAPESPGALLRQL